MSKEDWNINDYINTAKDPADRRYMRDVLADIREQLEVREFTRGGGRYIRVRHRETGIEVERKRGASEQESYLDAVRSLLEKLPPEYQGE